MDATILWNSLVDAMEQCDIASLERAKQEGRLTQENALEFAKELARVSFCAGVARWFFANFRFDQKQAHEISTHVGATPSVGFVAEMVKKLGLSPDDQGEMLVALLNGLSHHDISTVNYAVESGALKPSNIPENRYPLLRLAAEQAARRQTGPTAGEPYELPPGSFSELEENFREAAWYFVTYAKKYGQDSLMEELSEDPSPAEALELMERYRRGQLPKLSPRRIAPAPPAPPRQQPVAAGWRGRIGVVLCQGRKHRPVNEGLLALADRWIYVDNDPRAEPDVQGDFFAKPTITELFRIAPEGYDVVTEQGCPFDLLLENDAERYLSVMRGLIKRNGQVIIRDALGKLSTSVYAHKLNRRWSSGSEVLLKDFKQGGAEARNFVKTFFGKMAGKVGFRSLKLAGGDVTFT